VKRGEDEADVVGFDLIFVFSEESVTNFVNDTPETNEQKVYYLNLSENSGELEVIKLVPVFRNGKRGNVISELKIENVKKVDLGENEKDYVPPKSGGGSSGGSSGGSGGGGSGGGSCSATRNCEYYYGLNQCGSGLSDGCSNILNCGSCGDGETCSGNACVVLPSCLNDSDCSYLTGDCGAGFCNSTSGNCSVNYSAGEVCRASSGECDAAEVCTDGNIDCPTDVNVSDGESCTDGSCENGECVVTEICEPNCSGKICGSDGCGGSCGSCGSGYYCSDGECAEVSDDVIFVDAQLSSDCAGTYSIVDRDCSGNNGQIL